MEKEYLVFINLKTGRMVSLTEEEYMAIPEDEAICYKSYYPTSANEIDWHSDDYIVECGEEEKERNGYKYILRHGIGPGTLPRDTMVISWEDLPNWKTAVWIDRPLTSAEMEEYEVIYPS